MALTFIETIVAGVLTAIASAFAVQASEIGWAAKFLSDWGWLGLFVLSAGAGIYLYKQLQKERASGLAALENLRADHRKELDAQTARYDAAIAEARAEMKEATDKLIDEYRVRIAQLAKS